MKKIILIIISLFVLAFIVAIAFRVQKDIKKKLNFVNTYAIQNVETANAIRPYEAQYEAGVDIISYPIQNWECITWEFIEVGDHTFLLKNLYTEKTIQPKGEPKQGIALWQQPLGGTPLQYWQFEKESDENYRIRLKGTDLYITASSTETNSALI